MTAYALTNLRDQDLSEMRARDRPRSGQSSLNQSRARASPPFLDQLAHCARRAVRRCERTTELRPVRVDDRPPRADIAFECEERTTQSGSIAQFHDQGIASGVAAPAPSRWHATRFCMLSASELRQVMTEHSTDAKLTESLSLCARAEKGESTFSTGSGTNRALGFRDSDADVPLVNWQEKGSCSWG